VTYHALLNAMVSKGDRTGAWRIVTEMKSRLAISAESKSPSPGKDGIFRDGKAMGWALGRV
jgi:pentatricopeptide repeat protein